MAGRKDAARNDARGQTFFDVAQPVAHNDAEPFTIREVSAPLSLRARTAPRPAETSTPRRVAR
ncbi:MAG: hypothetical protein DI565_07100 [Ancylobacter novellus]|uniref:Uncharacterized protein n=1 Tax=Ancylobacter novellus TaxID=921 RepID=A0A2W5KQK5_ANCNO|nr:MAG: hypothetical protein DI565_07100 [Ancylobacter novellus]